MRLEIRKYLYDIQQACNLLGQFTRNKGFEDYLVDSLLRSAVERQFTIIGEAILQVLRIDPVFAKSISNVRAIINFRHVLVHGYAQIEHETVWGVIHDDLLTLQREVDALLDAGEGEVKE